MTPRMMTQTASHRRASTPRGIACHLWPNVATVRGMACPGIQWPMCYGQSHVKNMTVAHKWSGGQKGKDIRGQEDKKARTAEFRRINRQGRERSGGRERKDIRGQEEEKARTRTGTGGQGEGTCVRTPSRRRSRKKLISTSVYTSGSAPTSPSTWPTSRSARVNVGSTCTTQRSVNNSKILS